MDVKDGLARVLSGVDPYIKSTDSCIPLLNARLHLDQHLVHVQKFGLFKIKI